MHLFNISRDVFHLQYKYKLYIIKLKKKNVLESNLKL